MIAIAGSGRFGKAECDRWKIIAPPTPFGTALERKRWLRKLATTAPFRPSLRFVYHYFWRQGFRDGYRGWMLCRLLARYERMIVRKTREVKKAAASSSRIS